MNKRQDIFIPNNTSINNKNFLNKTNSVKHNLTTKDFALLIQGPPHIHSLMMVDYYSIFFEEIIYSSYLFPNDLVQIITKYNLASKCKFITNRKIKTPYFNKSNIAFQSLSTIAGLEKCSKPFVIKIRSDEYFLNLHKIIEDIDITKVNFSNVYFRHFDTYPYHVSDHIILCDTKVLLETFLKIKDICMSDVSMINFSNSIGDEGENLVPEQYIAVNLIKTLEGHKNLIIDLKDNLTNMKYFKKYFNIINIDKLSPYIIASKKDDKKLFFQDIKESLLYFSTDCNHIQEYIINNK